MFYKVISFQNKTFSNLLDRQFCNVKCFITHELYINYLYNEKKFFQKNKKSIDKHMQV